MTPLQVVSVTCQRSCIIMVNSCAALGCTEKYVKGAELSFHSFPADEVRRNVWTLALKRKNFKASKYTKICSKHFSSDCFDTDAFGFGRKLKRDAVPSIFNCPLHSASKGRNKLPQFERNTEKVSSATDNEMCSTNNQPLKQRRRSRKACMCDYHKEVGKDGLESTIKKKLVHRQKSRREVKKGCTAQALLSDLKRKQIITESIGEMLEVDLCPHTFIMNMRKEPEDYENEVDLYPHTFIMNIKQEPKDYENKFTEGPPITAECSVGIKEDPELDLGVDVIENGGVLKEHFQTSVCNDNIKKEPELTFEVGELEDSIDASAEHFVPEYCPSSIKKEEECDYLVLLIVT
ncbi:THAP domain-containing protein 2-like isoform X2 [Schistocerca piceifrons]|uniref:THAP domain-containing protein 2-like isoform X2 n=1 Tax=Schistocerca piceifrons TaxID=274613 RepID=UPI001F5E7108|nr:THAP domain-containing protein 2-like isoform X2 [Schistocerca piceifrons]